MDFHFAWGEEATLRFCSKHILLSPLFRSCSANQNDPRRILCCWLAWWWGGGSLFTYWMAAVQQSTKCSAFFQTCSAASGSCHLVVTVPPRWVSSAMQTVVFTSFYENKQKNQSILSNAQCPRLLISTLDPPVSFVFYLQTTYQPLEDCGWCPWLRWKKMSKALVNICKIACPLQLALPGSWSQRQWSNKTEE